jgi:hypothetical protein
MRPLSLLLANLSFRWVEWRSRPSYRVTWSWRSISQLPVIRPSRVVTGPWRNLTIVRSDRKVA